jgi:hypothetical protein
MHKRKKIKNKLRQKERKEEGKRDAKKERKKERPITYVCSLSFLFHVEKQASNDTWKRTDY